MNNPINLKQRTTNKYFSMVFSNKYKEWSRKTHKNQQNFADECGVQNKNSVSNWSTGKQIPQNDTFKDIIRVFNEAGMDVTIEDFIPHTEDDVYRYDPSYSKTLQDHNRDLMKQIGLSEGFLNFVFNNTGFSDPDEGYPVWSPLTHPPIKIPCRFKTDIEELKYLEGFSAVKFERLPLKTTEGVRDDHDFVVRMKDGSSFVITEVDLHILKDLQDSIVDVIKYFYFKRKKIMKAQEIEATRRTFHVEHDEKNHQSIMGVHSLGKEELIAIDPCYQYLKFVDKDGKEV